MSIDLRKSDPLYQQIIADIKEKIGSGVLQVGDRLGSHRDLSDQYGVSIITVRKALDMLISEEILYARVGKGTFVARQTPPVDHRKHKTIGLVLHDLSIPLFMDILRGTEEHAYEAGYNLLFSTSSRQIEKEEGQIERFQAIGVDGLIIASMNPFHRASESVRALHEAGFAYVMVSYVEDPELYYVGANHELGSFLATEHLIHQGRRRIAFLNAPREDRLGVLRAQGYRRALEAYDVPFDPDLVHPVLDGTGWNRFQSGYDAGWRIIDANDLPDAFFVYNDIGALGLQQALLESGLRVPGDVAIVGIDDIERASYATVPLTTIRQPVAEICRQAMRMLLERIGGHDIEPRIVLPPELVVRASSTAAIESPAAERPSVS